MQAGKVSLRFKTILAWSLVGLAIPSVAQNTPANTPFSAAWIHDPPAAATLSAACGEENLAARGAGGDVVRIATGADPGALDPLAVPAGRLQLFPDDGLLAYMPLQQKIQTTYFTTDTNTSLGLNNSKVLQEAPLDPAGSGYAAYFTTSGRMLSVDHDDLVTVVRSGKSGDPKATVAVKFLDQDSSTSLPGTLLARGLSGDLIATANADLDQAGGDDGNFHNELVVARVTGVNSTNSNNYDYELDVLNYGGLDVTAPGISRYTFTAQAPSFAIHPHISIAGTLPSDNILTVATGDFLGDGHREIALATLGEGRLLLYTFRYSTEGTAHRLTLIRSQTFNLASAGFLSNPLATRPVVGTLSTVAGDFDGSGIDRLAIGYAKWGNAATGAQGTYGVGILLFKYVAGFEARATSTDWMVTVAPDSARNKSFLIASRPKVQLTAGQFLLNPPSIRYGRKQLIAGWNEPAALHLRALAASDNLAALTVFGSNQGSVTGFPMQKGWFMAAGGYSGVASTTPTANLALDFWAGDTTSESSNFGLVTFHVNSSGIAQANARNFTLAQGLSTSAKFPVVAYDRPGNSRYLGSPAHITVFGAPEIDFLMQEPPKHAFWSEKESRVVNFTRFDGNNVHLFKGSTASMATTSEDHSTFDVGGSISASAGATVTAGGNFGLAKASSSTSVDVTAKASYDYQENESKYNSGYSQRSTSSSGQTDRDDYLKGSIDAIEIWRYRVYGSPSGTSGAGFYELTFPGYHVPFAGGGLNFDWYQPRHENGNILSYQSSFGVSPFLPTDMGSYVLPNGKLQNSPQVPAELKYFDGAAGSADLRYSNEVAEGGSFSYSHKLATSVDVKVANTSSASTPLAGGEVRTCGQIEVHESYSFGGSTTSAETTRDETAVTFNKTAGDPSAAYPFYPVVYTTQAGTVKLSYSVPDPTDRGINRGGALTFIDLYSGLPDPALNLPLRFIPYAVGSGQLEEWLPNTAITRKDMRGLFFRQSTASPITGTFALLGANPRAGDVVRIEPRIYNYSTGQTASSTKVVFQVIPYDGARNNELCANPINAGDGITTGLVCPRTDRVTIGNVVIPRLEPRQFTCVDGFDSPANTGCAPSAFLNWNTRNFGPTDAAATEYRVYLLMNPDEPAGTEIYGSDPAPVAITSVSNTTPIEITAPGNTLSTGDFVTIGGVRGLNAANGTFKVTLVSQNTFSLNNTVLSRGSYEGGGVASKIDPGQNNEGYGYISVARPQNLATMTMADLSPRDYLEKDALEAMGDAPRSVPQASNVQAALNLPLHLRFTAHSTAPHNDAAQVLLYDGDPNQGAPAIAAKTIYPGTFGREGTSIWLDWTPTTAGQHQLYAVLLEGAGRRHLAKEMEVNVLPGR